MFNLRSTMLVAGAVFASFFWFCGGRNHGSDGRGSHHGNTRYRAFFE